MRLNIPNLLSRGFAAIGVNDVVNATTIGACWMTKRCRQTRRRFGNRPQRRTAMAYTMEKLLSVLHLSLIHI